MGIDDMTDKLDVMFEDAGIKIGQALEIADYIEGTVQRPDKVSKNRSRE